MGYSTSGEFTNAERTKLANIEALADVTDNANVDAANAVMDADFSGASGFLRKTSTGVYNLITSQKLNADIIDLIRPLHPNVSMLAAMDETSYNQILKESDNTYQLPDAAAFDENFDSYNDGQLDGQDGWTSSQAVDALIGAAYKRGASGKGLLVTTAGGGAGTYTRHNYKVIDGRIIGTFIGYFYPIDQTAGAYDIYSGVYLRTAAGTPIFGVSFYCHTPTFEIKYFDASSNWVSLTTPVNWSANTWYKVEIQFNTATDKYVSIKIDDVEKVANVSSVSTDSISQIDLIDTGGHGGALHRAYMDDMTITADQYTNGDILTNAITANVAVLSFFSYLKGKFSNGASSHANPVQVEIFGNGDSYAAALNATTKFKIDVADPRIELYRTDDSEVAKSNDQTDWVLDDNATNGAFAAKTTSTHETILAEEIGCASIVLVEKSVNGAFTDTEILIEDDDYTVDYSTRTATKIILTSAEAADIVISQSKLRITWIADVEDIDGTANTALKMKIYLNRTANTEASPEIQKIDIGTDKYAEMQYLCG